ncbi:MAG: type II toxin-antitoxin system VapC family toxin [Fibromonadaceae bacterium]|nr:type II toxin-antitoxin system VapC family toxin [Fibromonadaceae bacterium]
METKISYLLDTCILVDFLRGNKSIYDILINNKDVNLSISTITMMELMLGAFNKKEVLYIQKAFSNINIIYINEEISKLGQKLLVNYNKSHNLLIDDALIAATSLVTKLDLMTYNKADFQYIPNIKLYKF